MSSQDEVLEYLVRILEETDTGISLTLSVNGLIISGQMISSKRYFDELSNFYNEKNLATEDPSLIEIGLPALQRVSQFLQEKGKSREGQYNTKFIHLRVVMMYPSDLEYPFPTSLWRGKLSSIDGFSIGRYTWNYNDDEDKQGDYLRDSD